MNGNCAVDEMELSVASRTTTDSMTQTPVAVEILRGGAVESRHRAVVAVVDHTGSLIAHFGDPDLVTFSRSTLKPLQALSLIARGGIERFGFEDRHLAVMCGSHSGEPCHTDAVQEILTAIDCLPDHLLCGVHVPFSAKSGDSVPPRSSFGPLDNNCSGKHAGMLALARILDANIDEYLDYASPVQETIRRSVGRMTGCDENTFATGIDGCSAPNYAFPLSALARGYAQMAHAAGGTGAVDDPIISAARRITLAMRRHPQLVSGTGRLDLALAEATQGQLIAKVGAEAVYCIAVPERGWGVAMKIMDGAGRALGPLVCDIIDQLDLLDRNAQKTLSEFAHPEYRNHRQTITGSARSVAGLIWDNRTL